jgi:glycosyltransferase involved in cell wall biosynthesis
MSPRIGIVLCTYNRAKLLEGALDALLTQTADAPPYEIVVVDNNSTDATADVVRACMASHRRVRYVFEPQQGLAYARNSGIAATSADIIAFTDDDVRPAPDWIRAIDAAMVAYEHASWIGGKVLPLWSSPPPPWLTPEFWPPLALLDYGDEPILADASTRRCLVGANLVVRRRAFEAFGLFSPSVQRVGDTIGSTEDHELQLRLWHAGLHGMYCPSLVVFAIVQPERLDRGYHRRWHAGHGRFYALMNEATFEQSESGHFLGVPLHVFRGLGQHTVCAVHALVTGQAPSAFYHELRARFLAGYARQRLRGAAPRLDTPDLPRVRHHGAA